MEKHALHLKNPELQKSPEVNRAVKREEHLSGEKIPNDPADRIETYMDRLEDVFLNADERVRQRNLDFLRPKIHEALLIKRENFPESYFELQQRIARERGQPVEHIPQDIREQTIDTVIEDQRHSLDAWVDYLTSPDAVYPTWFKYLAWNNIIKLSQFDKERGEFKKRTDSTVAPFPDIYREPLAQMADLYQGYPEMLQEIEPKLQKLRVEKNKLRKELPNASEADKHRIKNDIFALDQEIEEVSAPIHDFNKKFPILYAELIQQSLAASLESREQIQGEWVKYEQDDQEAAEKLFQSLEGKGTGWCTAGRSTAETQISSGDFYVYYTYDSSGTPTQPRLAIRMDGHDRIDEVRGILPSQNVEPALQPILDEKLQNFGSEADVYRKKSEDMKKLTAIDQKCFERSAQTGAIEETLDPELSKEELAFLYEINAPIEGFGYEEDSRVKEIRNERNAEQDMLVLFECTKEQIAHVPSEIKEDTKAYIGQLEPGIFEQLPETLEHVYTSFPERRIRKEIVEFGGKSARQLLSEMESADIQLSASVTGMLESPDFVPGSNVEQATLIRLTGVDLGFRTAASLGQIYERALMLGLELCPPDTGLHYRLQYRDQPPGEWVYIGITSPIPANRKFLDVLGVAHNEDGLWLYDRYARTTEVWRPRSEFMFLLPKSDS